jgi:hypothetical protein
MHQTFQRQPAPVDQAAHHALQKAADVARLQVGVRNVAHQPVEQVAHTPAIQHERGLATAQFFQKADFDLALRGDIHHAGLPGAARGRELGFAQRGVGFGQFPQRLAEVRLLERLEKVALADCQLRHGEDFPTHGGRRRKTGQRLDGRPHREATRTAIERFDGSLIRCRRRLRRQRQPVVLAHFAGEGDGPRRCVPR